MSKPVNLCFSRSVGGITSSRWTPASVCPSPISRSTTTSDGSIRRSPGSSRTSLAAAGENVDVGGKVGGEMALAVGWRLHVADIRFAQTDDVEAGVAQLTDEFAEGVGVM